MIFALIKCTPPSSQAHKTLNKFTHQFCSHLIDLKEDFPIKKNSPNPCNLQNVYYSFSKPEKDQERIKRGSLKRANMYFSRFMGYYKGGMKRYVDSSGFGKNSITTDRSYSHAYPNYRKKFAIPIKTDRIMAVVENVIEEWKQMKTGC